MSHDDQDLLTLALKTSLEAGAAILRVYRTNLSVELKEDRSPLTQADRDAQAVIARSLASGSSLPLLSEEGRSIPYPERKAWDSFWLVDPLDGTKEFLKRNGEFTVNLALIRGGRHVLGVVYVPVQDILYFGAEGFGGGKRTGASELSPEKILSDHQKLSIAPCPPSGPLRVVASRSHLSEETRRFIESSGQGRSVETLSAGSSLKFCLVAEGKADVYPRFAPTMEWDTAAGQALVEHSGGEVLDADTGKPLVYNKEDLHNPWFIVQARGGARS